MRLILRCSFKPALLDEIRLVLGGTSSAKPNQLQQAKKMGGAGFEPAKSETTDLQSVPFDRFGTLPRLFFKTASFYILSLFVFL